MFSRSDLAPGLRETRPAPEFSVPLPRYARVSACQDREQQKGQPQMKLPWRLLSGRRIPQTEVSPYCSCDKSFRARSINSDDFACEACKYRAPNRRLRPMRQCPRLSCRQSSRRVERRRLYPWPPSAYRDASARTFVRAEPSCSRSRTCGCRSTVDPTSDWSTYNSRDTCPSSYCFGYLPRSCSKPNEL